MHRCSFRVLAKIAAAFLLFFCAGASSAAGLYNDAEARGSALGGATSAQTGSVLSAMDPILPRSRRFPDRSAANTLTGALLRGEFEQPARSSHLKNGSNAAINGCVGSDSLTDIAPLRWRDQFIYRAGFEFSVVDGPAARAGYSYGRSPVPNEILTPLTGAIFEHAVSAGLGYRWNRFRADLAYQWRLPATQRVGESLLLDGEYSQTSLTLSAHLLQLTTGVEF